MTPLIQLIFASNQLLTQFNRFESILASVSSKKKIQNLKTLYWRLYSCYAMISEEKFYSIKENIEVYRLFKVYLQLAKSTLYSFNAKYSFILYTVIDYPKTEDPPYLSINIYGFYAVIFTLYNQEKWTLSLHLLLENLHHITQEILMAYSSKNPVSYVTNQLQNANIRDISAMKIRQAVGSSKYLSVAKEE